MKCYIATRLENVAEYHAVRDMLASLGVKVSYDWTTHGSVWREGSDVIRDTAMAEMNGVAAADFVIAILPGGRGTHVEIGAAIALNKPTFLLCESKEARRMIEASPECCAFYLHPRVDTFTSKDDLRLVVYHLVRGGRWS